MKATSKRRDIKPRTQYFLSSAFFGKMWHGFCNGFKKSFKDLKKLKTRVLLANGVPQKNQGGCHA